MLGGAGLSNDKGPLIVRLSHVKNVLFVYRTAMLLKPS